MSVFLTFPCHYKKTSVRSEYVTITVKGSRDSIMLWEAFRCRGLGSTCPLLRKGRVTTNQEKVALHAPIRRAGEISVWFNEYEHGSTVLFTTINGTEWGNILWKNAVPAHAESMPRRTEAVLTAPCVGFPWNSSPVCMLAVELKR